RVEERVGMRLAFSNGKRRAHGRELRSCLCGRIAQRLRRVDGPEELRRLRVLTSQLIGAAKGILEVDQVRLRSTGERLEHRKRAARIVLLQMCVGKFDRRS